MASFDCDDLEGSTLNVYAFVVKEGKPVGPREVMRGANLSSPSTACCVRFVQEFHRHFL